MSRLSGLIRASETRRWAVAALMVFALFAALLCISHVTYDTNDDCTIVSIAAGYLTGEPDPATVFTSYGYGLLLSTLYRLCAVLPWHTLLLLFFNALAQTALLMGCLTLCTYAGLRLCYGFLLFSTLWFGVLMRYSVQLQFSATASVLFAAGMLLYTLPDAGVGHRERLARRWMAAAFFLFCFALRPKVALMLAPYAAIPAVMNVWRKSPAWRATALFTLCLLLGNGALTGLDALLYHSQAGWSAFSDYDAQLTTLLDYSVNALPAQSYEAALASAGWSANLGHMVRNWFFLDSRIDTDTLATLNASIASQLPALPLPEKLLHIVYATGSLVRRYPMFQFNMVSFGLIATAVALGFLKRRAPLSALRAILPLGYAVLLIAFFFGVLGRFPLRIAFAVACPAYVLSWQSMADSLQAVTAPKVRNQLGVGALMVMLVFASAAVVTGGQNGLTLRTQYPDGCPNAALTDAVNAYAAEHLDTVFVTDFCQDFSPSQVYSVGITRNLVYWGNGVSRSPAANRQLATLGLQYLNAEQFFDPRVRLLLVGDKEMLVTYLSEDYGLTSLVISDQTTAFTVYQAMR